MKRWIVRPPGYYTQITRVPLCECDDAREGGRLYASRFFLVLIGETSVIGARHHSWGPSSKGNIDSY
jgi:hypothetical protein